MKFVFPALALLLTLFSSSAQSAQRLLEGQNEKYPLYTAITPEEEKAFQEVFNFSHFDKQKALAYRKTLLPLAEKQDALGVFMLAQCYDLYSYGLGTKTDAAIALRYYKQAADLNYAKAELFLAHVYRDKYLGTDYNFTLSNQYLQRALEHGDNKIQGKAYLMNAQLFGDEQADSIIYYLEKSIVLDTADDDWPIDYLISLYQRKADYQKIMSIINRTGNEQTWLAIAIDLIKGTGGTQNVESGLELLYKACDVELRVAPDEYMGSQRPTLELNRLHYCGKLITQAQAGKYLIVPAPVDLCF